jgi:hypothetical protein
VEINHRWPVLVCLVALLAAAVLLVSGCGRKKVSTDVAPSAEWFDDLRERIGNGFEDSGQVAALAGVVDQMEATMIELDRRVVEYYAKLGSLDREYGTTREQFQEVIDGFNAEQRAVFEKMLVYVAELRRIAGREGWKKLADIDKSLYESWQREL